MKKTDNKVEEFIRVDHAGERGAVKIYEGQLLALNTLIKNEDLKKKIEEMKVHETEHCQFFENEIKKRKIKPTKFLPLWDLLGVGLGFGSTLLGKKAAMACTVAVEEVIGQHYEEQAEELKKRKIKPDLLKTVKKFREDELEHHDTGVEHQAELTTGYVILSKTIKQLCYTAIKISKKY